MQKSPSKNIAEQAARIAKLSKILERTDDLDARLAAVEILQQAAEKLAKLIDFTFWGD